MQIRRSSYHNVVKVSDIENELDVTRIQIYVINSFDVVYLNKRDMDEPKGKRTGKHMKHSSQCETCRRNISDTYQFCSLGCKYAWVHKSESESEMSGSGSAVIGTNKGKEKLEEEEEEEITKALSSSQEDQKGRAHNESKPVPSWLKTLLSLTTLFTDCKHHKEEQRRERSIFCIDCSNKAVCIHCIASSHEDHEFIQISRSSCHNAVKVLDIENDLDITGVQTHVINRFNVVFLNMSDFEDRNAAKSCKHNSRCETCRRNISDSYQFCSLGCKYAWLQESESENETKNGSDTSERGSESTVTSSYKPFEKRKMEEEEIGETLPPQEEKPVPKSRKISTNMQLQPTTDEAHSTTRRNKATSNSNKRKGIPRRAPIFRSSIESVLRNRIK
ncbi:hypothetical protein Fmac_019562 [Flemingia macrophylla]|uniref:PLATZ transcription factor family protein n=1 Tax=Flemingia macrophylla TaxID=520843 RepID=A0ABD1M8C4_9FABA